MVDDVTGDRGFESGSFQQEVSNEPQSFRGRVAPEGPRAGLDLSGCPLHEIEIRGKREMLAVRIVERAAELPAPGTAPIRQIELVNA
jgi:hypothetical protein